MIFDLETHLKDLFNTLKNEVPRDADGMPNSEFWTYFNVKVKHTNLVEELLWELDKEYAIELKSGMDEDEVEHLLGCGGGDLIACYPALFKPLEDWVDCFGEFRKLSALYPILTANLLPKELAALERCLRLAWANFLVTATPNIVRFTERIRTIGQLCNRALMALFLPDEGVVEALPEPTAHGEVTPQKKEPAAQSEPVQRAWSERSLFIFQQLDPILSHPQEDKTYRWRTTGGDECSARSQAKVAEKILALTNRKLGKPKKGDLRTPASVLKAWRTWKKALRPAQS